LPSWPAEQDHIECFASSEFSELHVCPLRPVKETLKAIGPARIRFSATPATSVPKISRQKAVRLNLTGQPEQASTIFSRILSTRRPNVAFICRFCRVQDDAQASCWSFCRWISTWEHIRHLSAQVSFQALLSFTCAHGQPLWFVLANVRFLGR
jgi:hypothetical protein